VYVTFSEGPTKRITLRSKIGTAATYMTEVAKKKKRCPEE